MGAAEIILSVRDLRVTFRTLDGPVEAVKGVSLEVRAGETVAIVGESGSGKSQTMMAAMQLLAFNGEASGHVDYRGQNLLTLPTASMNRVRGARITMIFQEPMTSLDPLYTIGSQLAEPIRRHRGLGAAEARREAVRLLELVHIPHPERRLKSYPHELSGGQRQRIAIARAMILKPKVVVLDEPTSALDRSVQKQIVELLRELQRAHGLSYLFISHDLAVVRAMADYLVVMKGGAIVEEGPTDEVFEHPRHDYTRALMVAAFDASGFGRRGLSAV